MKKVVLALSALALLLAIAACTPENGGNQNKPDDLTVTGEVLEVTDCFATLTGYANLPFELGDAEVGIMYDTKQSFEDGKKVVATGLDGNKMFTVIATVLSPGTTYYYKSYVQSGMDVTFGAVKSFTTEEAKCPAGAVDLGIVMTREDGTAYRLYWAESNLCMSGLCSNPEDYGDYYAWGETVPYYIMGHSQDHPCSSWRFRLDHPITGYNWTSYRFQTSGESNENVKFSKYNTKDDYGLVDNIIELQRGEKDGEAVDDVARATLNGKWRMPTDAEWTALRGLKWDWTTKNGINGCLVTGKNGNSIFLPAAGYRVDDNLYQVRTLGEYWSSSLDTSYPYFAFNVLFNSDLHLREKMDRPFGFSIRPVSE